MIMTIALRFIPVFLKKQQIILAQVSRGADFQEGWLKSARNLVAIMVPLCACLSAERMIWHWLWSPGATPAVRGARGCMKYMSRMDYLVMAATAALVPFIIVFRN